MLQEYCKNIRRNQTSPRNTLKKYIIPETFKMKKKKYFNGLTKQSSKYWAGTKQSPGHKQENTWWSPSSYPGEVIGQRSPCNSGSLIQPRGDLRFRGQHTCLTTRKAWVRSLWKAGIWVMLLHSGLSVHLAVNRYSTAPILTLRTNYYMNAVLKNMDLCPFLSHCETYTTEQQATL